ncbi:MAG TPA: ATP-binding protein, partial [Coleofasciculaceae cyanobacterium]
VKAFTVGAVDYITKPFQAEEAIARVENQLRLQRLSKQLAQQNARLSEEVHIRKQAEAALQQALLSAEAANRAKSAFLANMSHELRSPLTGILGYAQMLQKDKDCTSLQKKGLGIIYQCGNHLLTLINDILDLSKIEANKLEILPEYFHFLSFLKDLTELFSFKAQQKQINFSYLVITPIPTIIYADEKRLRQVLMNLLSNAIKFTDNGGVTFKVEIIENEDTLPHSSIQNSKSKIQYRKIRFQIEDTGIGISPEELEKIFLPFEQVADRLHRIEGAGLGLAISQKIISLMDSKIFVESTPEVGSKFWFELDLPTVSTSMDSTVVQSTGNIIGYQGKNRRILIVDESEENRSNIANILNPIGFEILEAVNEQEGLKKAIEIQPDLILTDIASSASHAFDMVRELRQLLEFQNTIIIAISANALETTQQQSPESGCNDFLPKPIQSGELLNKVKTYLNLSWIYETQHKSQAPEYGKNSLQREQAPPLPMIMPPPEELVPLYEAAQISHTQRIKKEAIRLKQLDPVYTPFATRILELAEDFDCDEVIALLDHDRSVTTSQK